MRRRLLSSTLIVAVLAVVALGIPLGILGTRLVRGEAKNRVEHEAATLTLALEEALEENHLMTSKDVVKVLHRAPRQATLTFPNGRVLEAGSGDVGSDPVVGRVAAPGGTSVVVQAPREESNDQVFRVWLAVAAASAFALGTAIVLALLEARRLSQPLRQLAETSERLGHGDFSAHVAAGNVAEVAAVADALNASAERIAELVSRERQFSGNASHQLRTSLTGIRIRIEAAHATNRDPAVRRELEKALEQCDRMTTVIEDLLALARGRRTGAAETPVRDLVQTQLDPWRLAFERETRSLDVKIETSAVVSVGRGAIGQALDVLVDNSLKHGEGSVRVAARDVGDRHVSIEVGDEGRGIASARVGTIFKRSSVGESGVGLSLARDLVRAEGGRLDLLEARPPVFAIFLPKASEKTLLSEPSEAG